MRGLVQSIDRLLEEYKTTMDGDIDGTVFIILWTVCMDLIELRAKIIRQAQEEIGVKFDTPRKES